ncbi:nucleobase-ascorbate transporter 12 [Selaginella moellendorffii]|nr:nucleobase-ascorbate transporter 12 [Selaginella moellendorffii]XP_024528270.1 nucleobase-ascorbate transporter 12 [Selaginella moellendorffii]|eukprot:XP_002967685.2 nucleobase-ascorbate transporter 12 [Selaginella moellendorffii]
MLGSPPSRSQNDPESPSLGKKPGAWPPTVMEPLPANHGYNPSMLGSWARRTGYKSRETTGTFSTGEQELPKPPAYRERVFGNAAGGATAGTNAPAALNGNGLRNSVAAAGKEKNGIPAISETVPVTNVAAAAGNGVRKISEPIRIEPMKNFRDRESDVMSSQDPDDGGSIKQTHMKYEIRENPGLVPLILYGLQHYFSIIGSLILVPLVLVPLIGGNDNDTSRVVSTTLLVSGITTLIHLCFGSRLPLIQGPSFVYLAPALVIANSPEFSNVPGNRFKHTMKELQGAVIISSLFQIIAGYSGLMSFLLRVINPVIVSPTVAAVGLAFFTYGFTTVGSCVEIGIPQIIVVIIFALHLRKISIFGHRIFQIYAVPLGLATTWAYAFLLTETGAYNYKGCKMDMANPSAACQRHIHTMRSCRTDASHALRDAAWVRFPYPFQWGTPTFSLRTGAVMIAASIIASVDSVGSYHATSLLVASRAPTPGLVSRAIGLEGITSALAGLWGIGTGATTLTENVHTIAVTRMGSRHAVTFGAFVLIALSFIGKVGAFLASIPQVMVAALLCIMWAMLTAWGLSYLRYTETGSSRNVLIVGLSLFLSLSVPAYFQQYNAGSNAVQFFLAPYSVATHGPIQTKSGTVNFIFNSLLSMHMVIAFVVAFFLDNTVPGSKQERGIYVWSRPRSAKNEPAFQRDYGLPFGLWKFFAWVKWVGV